MRVRVRDLWQMAARNLWSTKLRTALTLIGVMIGIAAITSMMSFGIGLEKNIVDRFKANDLFTSLSITTKPVSINNRKTNSRKIADTVNSVPLNDSLVTSLSKMPEVAVAFPKIVVPAKAVMYEDFNVANVTGLPMKMASIAPYNDLYYGKYFSNDSALEAIVSLRFLTKLGMEVTTKEKLEDYRLQDTAKAIALADTLVGKNITLVTASINRDNPMAILGGIDNMVQEQETVVKIVGIAEEQNFSGPGMSDEIILPLGTVKSLPSLGFTNVKDFLERSNAKSQYPSIYVKTKSMDDLASLKTSLDEQNINYFSIDDGLDEMKKAFLILDSVLGVIGFISLLVAGFGIANTMLMSIMERTREIGIMKAVGASDTQVRLIFFFEAAFIGLVGAAGGLFLGWLMTRAANLIINKKYLANASEPVDMFFFPLWLILGALIFSVLLSLLAGFYPANRAARINPVDALRQN